jgi:hypothetical protein
MRNQVITTESELSLSFYWVLFSFNKYSESAFSGNLYSENSLTVESEFCTVFIVKCLAVCILCHIAFEVSLSFCCKFGLRYFKC